MFKISAVFLASLFLLNIKSDNSFDSNDALVPNKNLLHIGIVVENMDQSLEYWVKLLDLNEKPNVILAEGHHDNPTHYRGQLSDAKAKLAFMKLDNMQIELIEPIGNEKSHWLEFLETKGEGVHHIAFQVSELGEKYMELYDQKGFPVAQKGGWDGGEYAYFDGLNSLGVMVELLESYNDK